MKAKAVYSIKDLEILSGIKAHTLRIWEKRYQFLEPERTATNIRFYSNNDLKKILNISRLNKGGYKISAIARMSEEEINEKVLTINFLKTEKDDIIDLLIIAMIDLNEPMFDKTFRSSILKEGFENSFINVIFPFFQRIGTMWQTGGINPAQEHFVSNIVRQKLIAATDGLSNYSNDKPKSTVVLFLPENELHELSLLLYNYALKARNYKTIYLGQNVPLESLSKVIEIVKPEYLVSVFTNVIMPNETAGYLQIISGFHLPANILFSGRFVLESQAFSKAGITVFHDLKELTAALKKLFPSISA